MRVAFAGAEVGSNRVLLESMGVTLVSAQWWGFRRRGIPKKGLILADRFPDSMDIIIESGAQRAFENDPESIEEIEDEYWGFIGRNRDRILGYTEFDYPGHPREHCAPVSASGTCWPVWNLLEGISDLEDLCSKSPNVAITNEAMETVTTLAAHTRRLSKKYGTTFHALGVGKPDNLRQIPFGTASTLAWISPMKRGELIAWDGSKITRYPKDMRAQALPRFRRTAVEAGLDVDRYMDGDHKELSKLAVWSYLKMEERMNRGGRGAQSSDDSDDTLYTGLGEIELPGSDNRAVEVRKPIRPRDPSERTYLPVLGVQRKTIVDTDEGGDQVLREIDVIQSQDRSLRQCNTCFVAANCPAFQEDSMCAFELPVSVKTKEQLRSFINAILEMQGHRIAFARFAEELNGGYPDPNVGVEMDRFFKIMEAMKKLDESNETLRITMERQQSGGVLSAIFGDRVQTLRELETVRLDEDQTNHLVQGQLE